MTSSIKLEEVHSTSLRRQSLTEPRPQVTGTKIVEDRMCSSEDMIADRQTHRQTRSSQYSAILSGRSKYYSALEVFYK